MGNNFADLAQYRHTITHHPSSPQLPLKHTYIIFTPEFPVCRNLLIEETLRVPWVGELLVVKHVASTIDQITHIKETDQASIDLILKNQIMQNLGNLLQTK
jgi:hypothetical protein